MRRWRLTAAVLATALGTLVLTAPTASADTSCSKTIRVGDAPASEGLGEVRFPVTMAAPAGCPLVGSVWYSTVSLIVPDPAGIGDYTHRSGQITWAPGSGPGQRWIAIPVTQDSTVEANERFGVSLYGETGAVITDGLAAGTIIDDDLIVSLEQPELSTPRCIVVLTVSLSAPAATDVTVTWKTVNGTATAGDDFEDVASKQLLIPEGTSSRSFSLAVYTNNPLDEPQETFDVVLTAVSTGRIGSGQVQVVIPVGWGTP
jgi:Calx-beta domain